ncbi:PD-(D/E)XK nuclease family protein [Clostridium felsineum]|uniref:PD-(D/E)XK nuclease family protein n=1 Tax=Clostridium felsineum TaxID=36839 RepID=UPI0020341D07|nr:PD-(D/E)XK nuclease family protein [Clostridium felsineum]
MQFNNDGLPMWEETVKSHKLFNHNGVEFAILGMMDGILQYKDGSTIGFEYKTKSNSVAQVGNYKLKEPMSYHKEQCTAYSLLFGMDEFMLMYEAIAKDGWTKGAEARADFKVFYHKVTKEDQTALLDKLANVVKAIESKALPQMQIDKCLMCGYKDICRKAGE